MKRVERESSPLHSPLPGGKKKESLHIVPHYTFTTAAASHYEMLVGGVDTLIFAATALIWLDYTEQVFEMLSTTGGGSYILCHARVSHRACDKWSIREVTTVTGQIGTL